MPQYRIRFCCRLCKKSTRAQFALKWYDDTIELNTQTKNEINECRKKIIYIQYTTRHNNSHSFNVFKYGTHSVIDTFITTHRPTAAVAAAGKLTHMPNCSTDILSIFMFVRSYMLFIPKKKNESYLLYSSFKPIQIYVIKWIRNRVTHKTGYVSTHM